MQSSRRTTANLNSKGVNTLELRRNPTRSVRIGSISIGAGHPIAVQSMTATHTQDVEATLAQINDLVAAGADVVRVAVDSTKDAEALARIREQTSANLSVDLQENYRLAQQVAPARRQDPLQPRPSVPSRARKTLAGQSQIPGRRGGRERLRDPHRRELRLGRSGQAGKIRPPTIRSRRCWKARWSIATCSIGCRITRYCVSLKDSDPRKVIEVNRRFADAAARRAAAPGRDRGRLAARRDHQNPGRLRAIDQPRHRRHDPRVAHRAQRRASRKKSPPAGRFWPISRPAGCGASSISAWTR